MKKLTIHRLALADLRANQKDYTLLGTGIFLAIFLTCTSFLALFSLYGHQVNTRQETYGKEDGFLFQAGLLTAQDLLDTGLVSKVGTITQPEESSASPVGTYDEEATLLLNRQLLSGRLPQAPGEAALDETILERRYQGTAIGDTIEVSIQPRAYSPKVSKTFTVTGILRPMFSGVEIQSRLFRNALPGNTSLPQILLYSEDDFLEKVPKIHHLVFSYAPGGSLKKLHEAFPNAALIELDGFGYSRRPGEASDGIWRAYQFTKNLAAPVLSAGCALVLCAVIGILEAVSGQFARKERFYRMLRAVGATRGQLRSVSRRASLLLALLTAPAAVLCAAGLVWLCSLALPEYLVFSWKSPLFPAAILASFVLVWICAEIPAFFAARKPILSQSPGPLRKNTVPSRRSFVPHALISLRKLRFQPLQTVGSGILIFILNLSLVFSAFSARDLAEDIRTLSNTVPRFQISNSLLSSNTSLLTVIPESSLSMETVRELEQLPHVTSVTAQWESNVTALVDSVGTYLLTVNPFNPQLWQYHPELNPGDYFPDAQLDGWAENQASQTQAHTYLERQLDTKQISVSLKLVVVSDLSQLPIDLKAGQIDKARLDSGEAVLLSVPEYYVTLEQGGCFRSSSKPSPSDKPDHYDYFTENDQFSLGDILPLVQVCSGSDSDNLMSALFTSTRSTASPSIDGLTGVPYGSFDIPAVVTTPEGLQSLGLRCDNTTHIQINLDGPVDRATEDTLRDRIQRIAAREDGLVVNDPMSLRRASVAFSTLSTVFFFCLYGAILVITLVLICGTRIRDFRSQRYTAAVLQAMGCDKWALSRLYSPQILLCGLLGFLISLPCVIFFLSPDPKPPGNCPVCPGFRPFHRGFHGSLLLRHGLCNPPSAFQGALRGSGESCGIKSPIQMDGRKIRARRRRDLGHYGANAVKPAFGKCPPDTCI